MMEIVEMICDTAIACTGLVCGCAIVITFLNKILGD